MSSPDWCPLREGDITVRLEIVTMEECPRRTPWILWRLTASSSAIQLLEQHVMAWCQQRLDNPPVINWQFTTPDARIKLNKLYPSLLAS